MAEQNIQKYVADEKSSHETSLLEKISKPRKKFALGADFDKEMVFNFDYITDTETISYIQKYGKIMIIVRGPTNTGKATLREMLLDIYPQAELCCADKYFENSFNSSVRTRDTIKLSHVYCEKKAESACRSNANVIIVQNTHMRKWEAQPYINLAAKYNYTIIMSITLYRFYLSPEILYANNTDGLNLKYFQNRLRQWEDILPLLTGWILSPNDAVCFRSLALESLKSLVNDGKFCRIYNLFKADEISSFFKARNLLCCLAGYSAYAHEMKKYYLSDIVQNLYGKCYTVTILGYHISPTMINAIVHLDAEMKHLLFNGKQKQTDLCDLMGNLRTNNNMMEHAKVMPFNEKQRQPSESTTVVVLEDWNENTCLDISRCSFIHMAQVDDKCFDVENIYKCFHDALSSAADLDGNIDVASFTELKDLVKVCRLDGDQWLVKAPKKIVVKTIFTGLYL